MMTINNQEGIILRKKLMTFAALAFTASMVFGTQVFADAVFEKSYLALGADLKASEKKEVLKLLGVDEDDLDEYDVMLITNKDEHKYLDDYLSPSVIGSRALSSVLVEKKDEGNGIQVTTKNISYCTPGMYENALSTAGVTDADVVVAGPFKITGTAALVGAMKAYSEITGEDISEESIDAATQELVVTSDIAEEIDDSDAAEAFIAYVKEELLSSDDFSDSNIDKVIDKASEELGVDVTEEQKEQINQLMKKLEGLDLNIDQLKKQAGNIYNKIKSMDIDTEGFFNKLFKGLSSIFSALTDLFSGLAHE